MNNPSFTPFEFRNGELFDYSANAFPTCLYSWTQQGMAFWSPTSTYYGYVYDGLARMTCDAGTFVLSRGMYFAVPTTEHNGSAFAIEGGMGIVVERIGFPGVFQIGGPIERVGRLRYIDGCTDSLLIPPVKLGDPCLNALYFPPGTDQTQHTHPSMRVGIVVDGQGECVTPDDGIPLFPGQIFIIHEEGLHSFRTKGDASMIVIAYHPDSDFGPQDEDHPMLNRTIVDGVSAAKIDAIRTR